MGLINARILGGNNARGRFLAFIDAHVMVGKKWLETPYRYLTEVNSIVFIIISRIQRQL